MIRKLLNETSQDAAEWIWWMDADTLVTDMTAVPRFAEYGGYDLVVWGDRAKLMEGDMNGGALQGRTAASRLRTGLELLPEWRLKLCVELGLVSGLRVQMLPTVILTQFTLLMTVSTRFG